MRKFINFNFIARLVPAIILLQTLYFKFGGAQESIDLFSAIVGSDNESYLRITTGIMELIASILLLIPKTKILGALKTIGIMTGAILSHILFLGFDGLFMAALVAFSGATWTIWVNRKKVNMFDLF